METYDSFSNLLDEIFHDFESAMPVVVFYKTSISETVKPHKRRCRVLSVNGYLTLTNFSERMSDLLTNLMNAIADAAQQTDPEVRLLFLRQAMDRSKKLNGGVTPLRMKRKWVKTETKRDEPRWVFRNACYVNLGGPDGPEDVVRIIRRRVFRHAALWQLTVQLVMKELRCLYFFSKELPAFKFHTSHQL